jgi:hypothetical protein
MGKVYTDGNYAYYEKFSPEALTVTKKNAQSHRKETSVPAHMERAIIKERVTAFENRTDA